MCPKRSLLSNTLDRDGNDRFQRELPLRQVARNDGLVPNSDRKWQTSYKAEGDASHRVDMIVDRVAIRDQSNSKLSDERGNKQPARSSRRSGRGYATHGENSTKDAQAVATTRR